MFSVLSVVCDQMDLLQRNAVFHILPPSVVIKLIEVRLPTSYIKLVFLQARREIVMSVPGWEHQRTRHISWIRTSKAKHKEIQISPLLASFSVYVSSLFPPLFVVALISPWDNLMSKYLSLPICLETVVYCNELFGIVHKSIFKFSGDNPKANSFSQNVKNGDNGRERMRPIAIALDSERSGFSKWKVTWNSSRFFFGMCFGNRQEKLNYDFKLSIR